MYSWSSLFTLHVCACIDLYVHILKCTRINVYAYLCAHVSICTRITQKAVPSGSYGDPARTSPP